MLGKGLGAGWPALSSVKWTSNPICAAAQVIDRIQQVDGRTACNVPAAPRTFHPVVTRLDAKAQDMT